jgi:hypothetical protein
VAHVSANRSFDRRKVFAVFVALASDRRIVCSCASSRAIELRDMNGASKSNSLFTFPDSTSVPANGWILTLICLAKTVVQY